MKKENFINKLGKLIKLKDMKSSHQSPLPTQCSGRKNKGENKMQQSLKLEKLKMQPKMPKWVATDISSLTGILSDSERGQSMSKGRNLKSEIIYCFSIDYMEFLMKYFLQLVQMQRYNV